MCQEARAYTYIQFYNDFKEEVGRPLPGGLEERIPEKAVCYKKFIVFVCVLETTSRKIELKSEKFFEDGFTYPEATPIIDMAKIEEKCQTKTELSIIVEAMKIPGVRLIVNRLGSISVFHPEDTMLCNDKTKGAKI